MAGRNTLTKVAVVGGLLAALAGCSHPRYENDVKEFAEKAGWQNVYVEERRQETIICEGLDLYNVTGTMPGMPEGTYVKGHVCVGLDIINDHEAKFKCYWTE